MLDDEERYAVWQSWLASDRPTDPSYLIGARSDSSGCCSRRSASEKRPLSALSEAFEEFWALSDLRLELADLLDVLRERVRLYTRPIDPAGLVPIHSHATYALYEILAAYGVVGSGSLRETREGVLWSQAHALRLVLRDPQQVR